MVCPHAQQSAALCASCCGRLEREIVAWGGPTEWSVLTRVRRQKSPKGYYRFLLKRRGKVQAAGRVRTPRASLAA